MSNNVSRIDFIFSYWIFSWFLIYYFAQNIKQNKITKIICENMNPMIALIIGLILNIIMILIIILFNPSANLFIFFIIISIIIFCKVIPIYLIKDNKIKIFENTISLIVIFIFYNIYLFMNNENTISLYIKVEESLLNNEFDTPIFNYLNY